MKSHHQLKRKKRKRKENGERRRRKSTADITGKKEWLAFQKKNVQLKKRRKERKHS